MKTQARCIYCDKVSTGQGITRHLATHLASLPPTPRARAFHIKAGSSPYFLHLLVDQNASLASLDSFLRAIWLECCGHLSSFSYERWGDELPMSKKADKVFQKGTKLSYAYDFGSTTELQISCLNEYPVATKAGGIELLSRNEPIEWACDHCKKEPATNLCTIHYGDEERFFCDACAEAHEEVCEDAEYALMPVVNSPRMGACAYMGGSIDVERD